jgi:hypothetical protein
MDEIDSMSRLHPPQRQKHEWVIPVFIILIFIVLILLAFMIAFTPRDTAVPRILPTITKENLPIDLTALEKGVRVTDPRDPEMDYSTFVNLLSIDMLQKSISDGEKGLIFNISSVGRLLDGRKIDPSRVNGMLYIGPYPYQPGETKYRYKRFLNDVKIVQGKAIIPVESFLNTEHNTEGWTDRGVISVRVNLAYNDSLIGGYDTIVGFVHDKTGFHKVPWLTSGPFINRIDSRRPDEATISFTASDPAPAQILLSDGKVFSSPPAINHEILLTGLSPGREYTYRVTMSNLTTPEFRFRAAPLLNETRIVFAAAGDSRQGYGGFLNNFMGLNYGTLDMISARAYGSDAEFFIIAGDLVDGYTMSDADYATQFNAFKQCMAGFWNSRPVYTGMGNHELIYDIYKFRNESAGKKSTTIVKVDAMPYETRSSEAIYAEAFTNPTDAPVPSDARRPSYNESVYTVQYGPIRLISVNNDYWATIETDWKNPETKQFGGAPYGYIMDDQMVWIENELKKAEQDPSVKYVFVFAHCGLFPTFADAPMWRFGNDNTRAYTYKDGKIVPEKAGLIETRNRLALAIGNSSKVAAVINSHEHIYSRTLISDKVPAGIPSVDDVNHNGIIDKDEPKSPLPVQYPTWYLVAGCAGGPSYSPINPSPWTEWWKAQPDPSAGFDLSLQEHYLIITTDNNKVSYRALNLYGETIDEVDDLMAIKKR